ncbi:LINE-1 retrotransposable element ORF1 protein [Plecturocebus cupreus]
MPVIPAIWEAEAGESLEPGRQRLRHSIQAPIDNGLTYEEPRKCGLFSKEKTIRGGLSYDAANVELADKYLKTCIITMPGAVAKSCNPRTLRSRGGRIMRSRDQDHPGQHGETPSLLKIQKLAGHGGMCLQSQLLGRLRQENHFNPGGGGCITCKAEAGESLEPGRRRLQSAKMMLLHSSLGSFTADGSPEATGSLPASSVVSSPSPSSLSANRAWSGPQQPYSREARLLEGKLRNRNNFIINKLDVHSEAQSESQQLQRRQEDKYTKMGRNQRKKDENTRNQNTSPPTRDHNSSPAREQGWTETECDEMTESGFRRWVIRNFCELKEHVITQCKETKNLEKRFEEMLTRMDNLERTISELMELKNTTRELREACTSFNSRIDQAEERISEVEDQINEIKQECKTREKRVKGK